MDGWMRTNSNPKDSYASVLAGNRSEDMVDVSFHETVSDAAQLPCLTLAALIICRFRGRGGWYTSTWKEVNRSLVRSSVWVTVSVVVLRSRQEDVFLTLWRRRCGHWETEDSVRTDCEEAELPSPALAASFRLSSLISFSSSLSLLSSWARPRSRETDRERTQTDIATQTRSYYEKLQRLND